MKYATLLSLAALIMLFGCASIETPFDVNITEFSDGAPAKNMTYAGAGGSTAEYNMSRYLWAYYYPYTGGFPENVTVISVEFDMCGYQNLASYPSNIRLSYPQFGGGSTLLHAGQLNGCVHVTGDGNLLDSLITMNANPLGCCERDYVSKAEMRHPRVHNTTEAVELVLWDSSRNLSGVNYTCFAGDATRQVTGGALVERNSTYGVPSVFNFTCPAYGAEGLYTVTINRVATFNGATHDWEDVFGYYTDVVIADGGTMERFPLKMNFSSDTAGRLEISNILVWYNNRLEYGSGPTSSIINSDPPWASSDSAITDCNLEAEVDVGDYSDFLRCNATGTIADFTNCTDSTLLWSDIEIADIRNSTVRYTASLDFKAYDSDITNANNMWYFEAYGATVREGMVYDGTLLFNFSDSSPVFGYLPLGGNFGCDGAGAVWAVDSIANVVLADANWTMDNGCHGEVYRSMLGFGGDIVVNGRQQVVLDDNAYFGAMLMNYPMVFEDAVLTMDDSSAFIAYNSTLIFNNSLTLAGTPRFWVIENGNLTFANLNVVYPEVWIVDNVSDSEVRLNNINFFDHCAECTLNERYVLGRRFVSFDDAAMPFLNGTNATVVMYNVAGFTGKIYYYENYTTSISTIIGRGADCNASGRCSNINYNETTGTLTFDVNGLSSYAAGAVALAGGGGEEVRKTLSVTEERICPGDKLQFTVTYKGAPVSGVEVELAQYSPYIGLLAAEYTGADGEVEFSMPRDAVYRAYFSRDGYYYDNPYVVDYEMCEGECIADSDCGDAEECVAGACVAVIGACGYAANHAWVAYECCSSSDCEPDGECEEHACVAVQKAEQPEEQPPVEETMPPEQQLPEEEVVGGETGQETTVGGEPVTGVPAEGAEAQQSEACLNIFGICWYWWLAFVIVMAVAYYMWKVLTTRR